MVYSDINIHVNFKTLMSVNLLFILIFPVICKDENVEIDNYEKRVTLRSVTEKNGKNIEEYKITVVFVSFVTLHIFKKIFQGSWARFYCVHETYSTCFHMQKLLQLWLKHQMSNMRIVMNWLVQWYLEEYLDLMIMDLLT